MNKAGSHFRVLRFAVLAAVLGSGLASAAEAPERARSPLAGWTRMRLDASKFLFASAESTVERWPAVEGDGGLVRVHSELSYPGGHRKDDGFSLRGTSRGLPARWMEIDPGKRGREIRASAGGELTLRRFGIPEHRDPPWKGRWTEGRSETANVDVDAGGDVCGGPIDPWFLLGKLDCLVAARDVTFRLFSNDGLHTVIAKQRGTRAVDVDVEDLDGGDPVTGRVEVAEVELAPGPGEPSPTVFGMDGNITLLIDTGSGALVQIEGRRSGIGHVLFRLRAVSLKPRPRPAIPWPSEATSAVAVPAFQ